MGICTSLFFDDQLDKSRLISLLREEKFQKVVPMFSAHIDSICAKLTVAYNSLCFYLLTMSAEMLHLFFRFHRCKHMWKLLHITLMGKCSVTFRARRKKIHSAELCLFVHPANKSPGGQSFNYHYNSIVAKHLSP